MKINNSPRLSAGALTAGASFGQEKAQGPNYRKLMRKQYDHHKLKFIEEIVRGINFKNKRWIDFGCGDGKMMKWMIDKGAFVSGIDFDLGTLPAAKANLSKSGTHYDLLHGKINALKKFPSGSVDGVLAVNVTNYFDRKEDKLFYTEVNRVLKKGGCLVITQPNELFDLYTFKKFTIGYLNKKYRYSINANKLQWLITDSDASDNSSHGAGENPLTYNLKVAHHGFKELKQEFFNYDEHVSPSAVGRNLDRSDKSHFLNLPKVKPENRWKLLFVCSTFGSLCVKD